MKKSRINVKKPHIIIKKLGRHTRWVMVKGKKIKQEIVGQAYENTVEIEPRQTAKEYCDTLCHEILHLFLPDADEKSVTKMANIMADALWKAGYRRTIK
jgi:hypothetical protein